MKIRKALLWGGFKAKFQILKIRIHQSSEKNSNWFFSNFYQKTLNFIKRYYSKLYWGYYVSILSWKRCFTGIVSLVSNHRIVTKYNLVWFRNGSFPKASLCCCRETLKLWKDWKSESWGNFEISWTLYRRAPFFIRKI